MDQARADLHAPEEIGDSAALKAGLYGRLLLKGLSSLREGHLTLAFGDEVLSFGEASSELRAHVRVKDARAFRAGVLQGEVGLGEAFMHGWWEADDLVAVVRIAVRNMAAFDAAGGWLSALGKMANRLLHRRRDNHVEGSRKNISHHYDLGNAFYELWLDPTMAYSCAVYESADQPLEAAQQAKFDLICRKLQLKPEDHVLEIGTGWGGFALHAVRHYGCRVTTTTISRQQHDYAKALFEREGVAHRVTLRLEDYRHLAGTFDKAVSIEMFEAVGLKHYDSYFSALDRLLKPGGLALVQTITMNERRFPEYIRSSDWIQKYIFPGAELASLSEVLKSLGRTSSLNLHHMEEIGRHYARTLRAWREAFLSRLDEVKAQGFDGTFVRMWEYYLAFCEGAFEERYIGDAQVLLAKRDHAGSLLNEPF
jgi:cyclopropane-fatty-acyl-phospholipid synthase